MSRRTTIIIPDDVAGILDDLDRSTLAPLLFELLREHHRCEMTGDIWVGVGLWKGWRLTTAHSGASYEQPVLVGPDGVGHSAEDLK